MAKPGGRVRFEAPIGEECEDSPAVFLVLQGDRENVGPAIGTGFFASHVGLFFTAAHVLEDTSARYSVVQMLRGEKTFLQRIVMVAYRHYSTEVAVGLAEEVTHRESGARVSNRFMAVTSQIPAVGDVVCSYGFPNTVVFPGSEEQPQVVVPMPLSVRGVVEGHFPDGRDRVMQPGHCIQVSFETDPGASGSPVMDRYGRVFAVLSTGLEGGPSYVAPLCDLFDLPFPEIRYEGALEKVRRVRELLPFSGEAPTLPELRERLGYLQSPK